MSGGHFNYDQYRINEIQTEIEELIYSNNDTSKDKFGDTRGLGFTKETIHEFKIAVELLKLASIYTQRIDWLVSGDDGEETFHKRLNEELEKGRI